MTITKRLLRSSAVQAAASWLAALYIRFVFHTSRWSWRGFENPDRLIAANRPFIFCFWHGRLSMIVCARRRGMRYGALISMHRDGRLIARILRQFGVRIIGGPSSRDASSALQRCVAELAAGMSIGITPDGPRGPRMRASAGAVEIARRAGVPILPVAWSVSRRRILRPWDGFLVPLPFSRGVFIVGPPFEVSPTCGVDQIELARSELEQRINAISFEADRLTGHAPIEPGTAAADAPTWKARAAGGIR